MRTQRPEYTHAPPINSVTGSEGAAPCRDCVRTAAGTERITSTGLKIIRMRFGLHRSELPFLSPTGLKWYLLSLLSPDESIPSLSKGLLKGFPRVQIGWDDDGFPITRRLSRCDRWELAHSCSSLARSLPLSCKRCTPSKIKEWTARATSPSPPSSDPAYLAFCRKLIRKTFRLGWDKHRYPASVHSFSPTSSARAETNVSLMPADSAWAALGHPYGLSSKSVFTNFALSGRPPKQVGLWPSPGPDYSHSPLPHHNGFLLRVKEIPTVGKNRVIGIPSYNYDILGPLHRAIYGHLTTKKWLVHGTISADRISQTCGGDIQTSVDLVNATDGLSLDVTEVILSALLAKSVKIPGGIKELAHASLYPKISGTGKTITHGQMMGTYLSFPLLCLHSYCAASWAARSSDLRGLAINGDDALISHNLPLGDYPKGYEKNDAKTVTSKTVAELNSTVFLKVSGKWVEIRNVRRLGAETDFLGIRHMAAACQKAGPRWVSAFIRSGVGKRWNLSPHDLGLSTSHRLVWLRGLRQRGKGSNVSFPDPPRDPRYLSSDSEPSDLDKIAFGFDLFDNGRSNPHVEEFNPSRTQVLKSCCRRPLFDKKCLSGRLFKTFLSYDGAPPLDPPASKKWFILNPDFEGPDLGQVEAPNADERWFFWSQEARVTTRREEEVVHILDNAAPTERPAWNPIRVAVSKCLGEHASSVLELDGDWQ